MRTGAIRLSAVVLLLWHPAVSAAQTPPAVEAWGAFSGVVQAPSGTLLSSYSPPLASGTAVASSATQTLALDGNRGPGFEGGLNWFPFRFVGLQVLVDRSHVTLSGANGAYTGSLDYISQQPPDYVPRQVTTGFSVPWPDTTGSLTQWGTYINAVARTVTSGRFSASISGGVGWDRLSGQAEPLGYTEYRLGGHSVLFSDQKQLAFALGPANRAGFDVGGDLDIAVSSRVSVIFGFRRFEVATEDVAVRLTGITNPDQVLFDTPLDEIAQRLQPGPARVSASGSRLVVGLKIAP
jgi:hypothetical protein